MKKDNARILTGGPSIFLDSLRIGAAFTVLYIHAFDKWFPNLAHNLTQPGEASHSAVIIFFVLSGYVIAHTTISKNRGAMQYAQARLTRLYSIVVPSLLITAIVQLIIAHTNPQLLLEYTRGKSVIRYIMSGLFINESWFFSASPPLNQSLWSLSFEFWYYTIFGICFFRSQEWRSIIFILIACLIAGPKILLMMPTWLFGYLAYRFPRPALSPVKGWVLVCIFLCASWLVITYTPPFPYVIGHKPFYLANQFITDWIIGFFISVVLWILPEGNNYGADTKWANGLRTIADLTFPLYILHFPLLVLWRCLFGLQLNNTMQLWEALTSVSVIAFLIGWVLEKQRFVWARFFKWILNIIKVSFFKNKSPKNTFVNRV